MTMSTTGYVVPMWSYSNPESAAKAFSAMKATGINSVEIDFHLTSGTGNYNSNTVTIDAGNTLANLVTVINLAKAAGLQVWFKPMIEVGTNPGAAIANDWPHLAPSDPAAWFASYTSILTQLGQVLQSLGVGHYIITNELSSMTTNPAYAGNWASLIGTVRSVYSGAIGFNDGAFWGTTSAFLSVPDSVIGKLDFEGLSVYPRFGKTATTETIAQVQSGWFSDTYGNNNVAIINNWVAKHPSTPLYFTELGSPSVTGGDNIYRNNPPSAVGYGDFQDQANYLLGSLSQIQTNMPAVRGTFVYEWSLSPQPVNSVWDVSNSPIVTSALTAGWHYS